VLDIFSRARQGIIGRTCASIDNSLATESVRSFGEHHRAIEQRRYPSMTPTNRPTQRATLPENSISRYTRRMRKDWQAAAWRPNGNRRVDRTVEAILAGVGNQKGHAPGRMARRRKIRIVGDDEVFGVRKLQIWQKNAGKEGTRIRTRAEQIPGSESSPWTAAVCGMIFQSISSLGNR
jgi:hypothetical protein